MINITLHIEYLLTRHDCVILPGWGAFLSQHSKAFSFEDTCQFKKPGKFYVFNSAVNHNDGLLVNSIVRREGLSYEMAVREVEVFVASLNKQIEYDDVVSIGRIGCFRKQFGNLVFEPYHVANSCDDNFGLVDLSIKTIQQLTAASDEPQVSETLVDSNVILTFGRRFVKVAASIVVMIGLAFMLSTPLTVDDSVDYAALNSAIKVRAPQKAITLAEEGVLSIALPEDNIIQQEIVVVNDAQEKTHQNSEAQEALDIPHNSNGLFYLIVASLDTKSQAEKFISSHTQDDLRILECDGRYRVYAAQSNSYKTLKKVSEYLNAKYPGCWIIR